MRGIGAPAIWTILPAHIEEVLDRSSSSLYIGIYQSILLVLSAALAFLIGKPLLSQWVDIFQVNIITLERGIFYKPKFDYFVSLVN